MLWGEPKKLCWNAAALKTFEDLKRRFTNMPILKHLDPDLPFIIEVDASNCRIGAVLSQHLGVPAKLFPCTYYSRKLTTAEVNYNVGNNELLSIKAILGEWRHWL